jgi:glutamate dehydrogenase (NADP+)
VLTGKGLNWGGSLIRPEATGYGCVYFAEEMLKTRGESLKGKVCLVSGSGNVAQYTVEKLLDLGAKPVTLSDSDGVVYDPDGIDREKLAWVMDLKNKRRGRIEEYTGKFQGADFVAADAGKSHNPLWASKRDCAFPSATQNEINAEGCGRTSSSNGCKLVVSEGANMPHTARTNLFLKPDPLRPGQGGQRGGVATSGLEMSAEQQCACPGRAKKWTAPAQHHEAPSTRPASTPAKCTARPATW